MGRDHTMITENIYPFEIKVLTNNLKTDLLTQFFFLFFSENVMTA